jgi:serine-type D-Ala-D-Ala carboxypeptidase (penicillin-binding protein 5/6)
MTLLRPQPRLLMRFLLVLLSLLAASGAAAQNGVATPSIAARSWLLVDLGSGQTLAAGSPDERIEPASLTKVMTAYLVFAALKQGNLKLDQEVPVSEKAWKAPGSRMFIEPNRPVTVDQLIHGMVIESGNDASIALAEAVAGSEEAFVEHMNREARRLGLTGTHYANATGLPDPQHYTTARDLARLTKALIHDFPGYYNRIFSQKEFTYNKITQPNRNRLLWLDPNVDGVKTGHTESAGYCLIASGKRGPRRLLSVVIGTHSDSARALESQKLLNFGFQYFEAIRFYRKDQSISKLKVFKGSNDIVNVGFLKDLVLSLPKGLAEKFKVQLVSQQPLLAPVQQGQRVATLRLMLDDKVWGEYPVVALESVPLAGIFGRAWDSLKLWLQ